MQKLIMLWLFICSLSCLATEPLWIDVRSADEFQQGYVAGAVNIPHDQIAAQIAAVTTDKTAEIQLYCRSGRRSGLALEALKQLGYLNAVNAGGYADLKAAGRPVIEPKANP